MHEWMNEWFDKEKSFWPFSNRTISTKHDGRFDQCNCKLYVWVFSHSRRCTALRLHAHFTNVQRTSNFTYIYQFSRITSSIRSIKSMYALHELQLKQRNRPRSYVVLCIFFIIQRNEWNNFYFTQKWIQVHCI